MSAILQNDVTYLNGNRRAWVWYMVCEATIAPSTENQKFNPEKNIINGGWK